MITAKSIEKVLNLRREQKEAISILWEKHGFCYEELSKALRIPKYVIETYLDSVEHRDLISKSQR